MEDLLVKYVRNECSPEEEQWVIGWLQNPHNEAHLRGLMRRQWNNPVVSDPGSPNWQRMWLDISRQTKHIPTEPETPLYRTVWHQILRIAIWVVCIIVLGLGIRYLRQAQLPADATHYSGDEPRVKVSLPDQSAVFLKKHSSVRVSSDWSGPNREIWVNGEAVVIVARQPIGFRFQIHTANHVVTEARDARVYVSRKKQNVQVVVERGRANFILHYAGLLGQTKEYALHPGDMAEYNEKSTQLVRRHVNPAAYTD